MDQIITLGQSGSNLALGVTEARNVNAVKSFFFFSQTLYLCWLFSCQLGEPLRLDL